MGKGINGRIQAMGVYRITLNDTQMADDNIADNGRTNSTK